MLPRAVFFDLDDTLLDGHSAMEAAWAVVCADFGPRLGVEPGTLREVIRREGTAFWKDEGAVGHWRVRLQEARTHVIGLALRAEGLDTSLAEPLSLAYGAEHRAHLRPFDDAFETLEAVRAAGLRTALLTNGPRDMQRDKIERFDVARHMDAIVIEGEFGKGKPSPEVFVHALTEVGVEAAAAWMVGDNLYADVGGAKAVGLHAIWIHRERLTPREDIPAVPDRAIARLAELREALDL